VISGRTGQLITLHPRIVDKWARRYIHIYHKDGAVYAKRWATQFLPEEARAAMSARVREIAEKNKKGPEEGPE